MTNIIIWYYDKNKFALVKIYAIFFLLHYLLFLLYLSNANETAFGRGLNNEKYC
jgi:hypothetical protein